MKKNQVLMIALVLFSSVITVSCITKSGKTSAESEHQMPLLRIDAAGMDVDYDNQFYWFGDSLFIGLEAYAPFVNSQDYDEQSMLARIKELETFDFKLISINYSDESNRLGYGTWNIVYQTDEDYCNDLYFRTPFAEYRVHASTPLDATEKYKDEIKRRFESITLLPPLQIDASGLEVMDDLGAEYIGNVSYTGDILYVKLQALVSLADNNGKVESLNENNINSIINRLEGPPFEDPGFIGADEIKFSLSEKYSKQLSCPAYVVKYKLGGNEDMRFCTDLFFKTDKGYYRVHLLYNPNYLEDKDEKKVERDIQRILSSVSLDTKWL